MLPASPDEAPQARALKPLSLPIIIFLAVAGTLLLVIPGIYVLTSAFAADTPISERLLLFSIAAVLLALPARVAFLTARRKRTTGQFLPADAERLKNRSKWAADRESPLRKKLSKVFWIGTSIFWLIFAAYMVHAALHDPSKRGWAAFVLFLAALNLYIPLNFLPDLYRRMLSGDGTRKSLKP
jgi:hypothetical protein